MGLELYARSLRYVRGGERQRPGDHAGVEARACRDPQSWKGFKLGVPFAYSMHNYLLRYYLAEHGVAAR